MITIVTIGIVVLDVTPVDMMEVLLTMVVVEAAYTDVGLFVGVTDEELIVSDEVMFGSVKENIDSQALNVDAIAG